MNEFLKPQKELQEELSSSAQMGLTAEQVDKNRAKHGANVLTQQKQDSLCKRILEAATEPMIIMLIVAGLIALAVNIFRSVTGGEADFLECVGIFAAISLSAIISVVMEGKCSGVNPIILKRQSRLSSSRFSQKWIRVIFHWIFYL